MFLSKVHNLKIVFIHAIIIKIQLKKTPKAQMYNNICKLLAMSYAIYLFG